MTTLKLMMKTGDFREKARNRDGDTEGRKGLSFSCLTFSSLFCWSILRGISDFQIKILTPKILSIGYASVVVFASF